MGWKMVKQFFRDVLDIFFELFDLKHDAVQAEHQEEQASEENINFLVIFIITILIVILLIQLN